jgi:hypothetical protein
MSTPSFETVMHRIGEIQPPLPPAQSLLIGAVVLGAVMIPVAWFLLQHVGVIAHEAAHAAMGSGLGRKVGSVRLNPDGTGETRVRGGRGAAGTVAFTAIGYFGPSLFGLGAAKLISVGHVLAVLWLALLALACLLPLLRGFFSWAAVIVIGAAVYLVARDASVTTQTVVAYGIAWLLLVGGIRMVALHGSGAADASALTGLTRISAGCWSGLWLIGTVLALVAGGVLLT